jgi:pimeloyl-ACP methyl ester carboxylesterase
MLKKLLAVILALLVNLIVFTGCRSNEPSTPTPTPTPAPVRLISEDISWKMGDTMVSAAIARPDSPGPHPAIVFVAGSGPTDKDWNSPLIAGTNGSARLLAEELAKSGFVTVLYDKRFTGPYAERNMPFLTGKISLISHVEELAGAVNLLFSRNDVNTQQIYAVANSEGTIHALNYQLEKEPKLAGMVLLAPPGRPLAAVMRTQIEAQVAALPNAGEIMEGYDKLMAEFLAGRPFVANPDLPEGINNLFKGFYQPVNLPFTREIFIVDAASLLNRITVPVLVVIGKKDIQVDWQLDGAPLENAAKGHPNITLVYPENANHVLKYEPRPRAALSAADALTYNASDRVLDPDALQAIKVWLAAR